MSETGTTERLDARGLSELLHAGRVFEGKWVKPFLRFLAELAVKSREIV